jgi:hypothetical protein
MKTKEIVKKEEPVSNLIAQAIDKGLPVETMEKLLSMQERWEKTQAQKEFVRAMSDFQEKCPVIKKTKKVLNKDGRTVRYQYAPLDSIVEQIKKPLKECGVSYRWETKNEDKNIKAICTVTHVLGHSESSEFAVPIDTEGYMTEPQKYASALTFAKRYSLCNALGISTGDEDTDAVDVGKEKDVKSVKAQITLRLRNLKEKTHTKDEVEEAVKRLTHLELKDENLDEIASRLQILINESHEN